MGNHYLDKIKETQNTKYVIEKVLQFQIQTINAKCKERMNWLCSVRADLMPPVSKGELVIKKGIKVV